MGPDRDAERRAGEVEASYTKQLRGVQERASSQSLGVERRLREEGELAQRLSSRNTDLQVPISSPVLVGEQLRLTVEMDGTRLEQYMGLLQATCLSSNWTSGPQGVFAGFKAVAIQPCRCLTQSICLVVSRSRLPPCVCIERCGLNILDAARETRQTIQRCESFAQDSIPPPPPRPYFI